MDAKPGVRLAQNGAGASEAAFAGGGDTEELDVGGRESGAVAATLPHAVANMAPAIQGASFVTFIAMARSHAGRRPSPIRGD